LKRLGVGDEEQIAGLLHDVSQFSFSHIVDWVFADGSNGNESYHDSLHDLYISSTSLPAILARYGYDTPRISDEGFFPILENDLPDLCADRIDYSLRELHYNGHPEVGPTALGGLALKSGKIVFVDMSSAKVFAEGYMSLQRDSWGNTKGVASYAILSSAFKRAVGLGAVEHDDFWLKSEDELIEVIKGCNDDYITDCLERLKRGDYSEKRGEKVYKKFRYVDPFVEVSAGGLKRLSDIDNEYALMLEEARRTAHEGVVI
ncbi:MAG: hypothetical protein ACM3KH_00830, partial [Thiobacillus sp.]